MKFGFTLEDMRQIYPELTDDYLDELKKRGEEYGVYNVPPEQLALFAHSCYFDKEASKKCMSAYYRLRKTVPEFFACRDPRTDALQFSLKALKIAVLPVPDPQGNIIIIHRLADFQPQNYMLNDAIKLLIMATDISIYSNGCSPGYVCLFDMHGSSFRHLLRLSVTSIKRYFEYVQEALPIRLKAIHVVNVAWFMDRLLAILRPFMKKELFDMMHLHHGDIFQIYQHIPPDCLPSDYGGKLESVDKLHEELCQKMEELRDHFEEEEKEFRNWHPRISN